MIFEVGDMNEKLIGKFEFATGNVPVLTRARLMAQVLTANMQDNVAQAVQASSKLIKEDLDRASEILKYTDPYKFFSWIALNLGKGDPNCGNWMTWSILVFFGNEEQFIRSFEYLRPILDKYNPNIEPVHPDLQSILNSTDYTEHFTARRIPKVQFNENELCFELEWPGLKIDLVGNVPKKVYLSDKDKDTFISLQEIQ
ncbi:MAG: hypothetical protein H6772_04090 [Pseudomonadales bacterium]|nr:hypothetical protein [Pseudomonadales bacterium]